MLHEKSIAGRNIMARSVFWIDAACATQKSGSREQNLRCHNKLAIDRFWATLPPKTLSPARRIEDGKLHQCQSEAVTAAARLRLGVGDETNIWSRDIAKLVVFFTYTMMNESHLLTFAKGKYGKG